MNHSLQSSEEKTEAEFEKEELLLSFGKINWNEKKRLTSWNRCEDWIIHNQIYFDTPPQSSPSIPS